MSPGCVRAHMCVCVCLHASSDWVQKIVSDQSELMSLGCSAPQLAESKRKSDDDQTQIEELRNSRKKMEKDMEALRERVEEVMAENQRVTRSKKKIQEEVN